MDTGKLEKKVADVTERTLDVGASVVKGAAVGTGRFANKAFGPTAKKAWVKLSSWFSEDNS